MAKTNLSVMAGVARTPPGAQPMLRTQYGPVFQVARQRSWPLRRSRHATDSRMPLRSSDHATTTSSPATDGAPQPWPMGARHSMGGPLSEGPFDEAGSFRFLEFELQTHRVALVGQARQFQPDLKPFRLGPIRFDMPNLRWFGPFSRLRIQFFHSFSLLSKMLASPTAKKRGFGGKGKTPPTLFRTR